MHTTPSNSFSFSEVVQDLKHYLPTQTPLKDFIHHNTLHAFQQQEFFEALFTAQRIFGYKVTLQLSEYRRLFINGRIKQQILENIIQQQVGEADKSHWLQKLVHKNYYLQRESRIGMLRKQWKILYGLDVDTLVQPILFRIISSYLDQGIGLWHFPETNKGLLEAIKFLENDSHISFFKTKKAKQLLLQNKLDATSLLAYLVADAALYKRYLFDQQFSHKGWSGMVAMIEEQPDTLLYRKKITLNDFIILELLLELDTLWYNLGDNWKPISLENEHEDLFAPIVQDELHKVLNIWQQAFEWSYYDEVLTALQQVKNTEPESLNSSEDKKFQAIFCIDERECSLRRHLEAVEPNSETFGCPGFFGVEFYFHPEKGKFYEKLCPTPVTPKHLIKEVNSSRDTQKHLFINKKSHTALQGFLYTLSFGFWAAVKLIFNLAKPNMETGIANAFAYMNINGELLIENNNISDKENGLQVGFTVVEMADRVERLLQGIGLTNHFAPLIYVIAHGSSTANNPHHGAYDCGACSGRPGSVNARVFAFMANHTLVRKILAEKGIVIPNTTQFVGGLHDTASDDVAFFDTEKITSSNTLLHQQIISSFEEALSKNARERSRRFASINQSKSNQHVREEIRKRAVSYFEPRPELGHSTNALCFIGNRALTKGLFLDRRAFMNSYDYRQDKDGKILLNVISPLAPVCGGINLEYFFSRMDTQKLGAGSKLSHNIFGLIGVANSVDGDLRTGLPIQMTEVHDPVRLMMIVEQYPAIVLKTIQTTQSLYNWFKKGWIGVTVIHPDTNLFYTFRNDQFELYHPIGGTTHKANSLEALLQKNVAIQSVDITDTTQQNLPIHLLN